MSIRSEMIKFAILCKASSSAGRQQVLDQYSSGTLDVQILDEYSNEDVMCVRDQQTGEVILAIRGTDNKNKTGNRLRDVISDLFILINRKELMPRLVEIEGLVERLSFAILNYSSVLVIIVLKLDLGGMQKLHNALSLMLP